MSKNIYVSLQIPVLLLAAAETQKFLGFLNEQAEDDDDSDTVSPTAVAGAQGTLPNFPAASPTTGPTTTASAGAVELDANKSPWDERIHASTKNKNKDGTWKKRKGVDDALFKTVTAEITAGAAAGSAVAPTGPALPGPAAPTAGPSLPVAVAETPYQKFVKLVAEHSKSPTNPNGRITPEYLKQVIEYVGVSDGTIQSLAHNEPATIAADKFIREQLGLAAQ